VRTETDLLEAIASATDPDEAERLFREATRQAEESKDQANGWRAVELRAERRWGQLLGPAETGRPTGSTKNVSGSNVISGAERFARNQARKVAHVTEVIFERYLMEMKGKTPTRTGLLAAERRDKLALVINDMTEARGGKPPSGREVQREQGLDDDRTLRKDWDYLHKEGRVPARPVSKDEATQGRPALKSSRGRTKNWDGMSNAARLRELKKAKAENRMSPSEAWLHLWNVQATISRLCGSLENVKMEEYDLDDPISLLQVGELHNDLVTLIVAAERNLTIVNAHLKDDRPLRTISKLRDPASHNGRTPEEIDAMLKVADKMEDKLTRPLG
jgi:hypothetical protein